MEENEQPIQRGPGRPRLEQTMNPEWYKIIIDAGIQGKHITDFLITLGISWDGHYDLLKRNKKYSEAFKEYQKLCEQWWYERAYESVLNGESNKFNQRLWTIIMKNKFKDNWMDEKQVDIRTMGEKLNQVDNTIQVEIIRKTINENESNREEQ
jgi:hypothetical protein